MHDATSFGHSSIHRGSPRVSVVLLLSENQSVSEERLAERLRDVGDREVDVIVACAGQPSDLPALQRAVGDAQFLLAPAGTSAEDLRELAMQRAPGDIVTLLNGTERSVMVPYAGDTMAAR
jgi:hypothetical protein